MNWPDGLGFFLSFLGWRLAPFNSIGIGSIPILRNLGNPGKGLIPLLVQEIPFDRDQSVLVETGALKGLKAIGHLGNLKGELNSQRGGFQPI